MSAQETTSTEHNTSKQSLFTEKTISNQAKEVQGAHSFTSNKMNKVVGVATVFYRELVPPQLTGQESIEELIALRKLSKQVIEKFCEQNPDINKELWRTFAVRCILKLRNKALYVNFRIPPTAH
ncbi:uncharacterized protein LOC112601621 [Melanaphis sacchari]|uniref:uncharacterized protein LOC112601621 n=1 Tax=Melanaphis sacchari TaxID=742174 RepID=UPI000DC13114|nr:uncharacterized protein LOC112601621 [Melanaphis sacchari]